MPNRRLVLRVQPMRPEGEAAIVRAFYLSPHHTLDEVMGIIDEMIERRQYSSKTRAVLLLDTGEPIEIPEHRCRMLAVSLENYY